MRFGTWLGFGFGLVRDPETPHHLGVLDVEGVGERKSADNGIHFIGDLLIDIENRHELLEDIEELFRLHFTP